MEKIDLFGNLINLAAVDGKFTQEEINFLMVRAEDWGIAEEEVEAILNNAMTGDVELIIPEDRQDRVEMLREMIYLMAVDGELAEAEKRLCATASAAMDFSTSEFNKIVDELLRDSTG